LADYPIPRPAKSIELPDLITWAEQEFYIPELSGPIELYPYQKLVLQESQRKDSNGKYIYNTILWSDIKKSAKSCITAIVALHVALSEPWRSVKIIANDLKQADSRSAFYLRRALELNPNFTKGQNYRQSGYTVTLANNSVIEALPIDPSGEAGGNDDLIIWSELWAAKHKAMESMWTEMRLSPTKFGYSQRWVESYAGYEGESPILERLYERGVKNGEQLDLGVDGLEVYRSGDMLALWNTIPRLPWQTQQYYDSEEEDLLPGEFDRIHRNQWGSSVEKFVDMTWWDNCQQPVPQLTKDTPVIISLDAAKGGDSTAPADCFAMIMVSRQSDNVLVHYCGIWQPGKGQLLDYEPIEQELVRLCNEFSIVEVAYDSYQLHSMCTQLKRTGIANFREFKQANDRLVADKQLRDLIINKRLQHDGNPLLRQHIDNANIKNHGEDGIRIIKRNPKLKVDAAVALSMAASRCLYYNLG
jgi:phage terminase large subunit-like protein